MKLNVVEMPVTVQSVCVLCSWLKDLRYLEDLVDHRLPRRGNPLRCRSAVDNSYLNSLSVRGVVTLSRRSCLSERRVTTVISLFAHMGMKGFAEGTVGTSNAGAWTKYSQDR